MARLLRTDLLPEAQLAPAKARQFRALLRHRISLIRLATQLRNRIHAVAAGHGYDRSAGYRAGPDRGWLAGLDLPVASQEIITGCLAVAGGQGLAAVRCVGWPIADGSCSVGRSSASRGRAGHCERVRTLAERSELVITWR